MLAAHLSGVVSGSPGEDPPLKLLVLTEVPPSTCHLADCVRVNVVNYAIDIAMANAWCVWHQQEVFHTLENGKICRQNHILLDHGRVLRLRSDTGMEPYGIPQ